MACTLAVPPLPYAALHVGQYLARARKQTTAALVPLSADVTLIIAVLCRCAVPLTEQASGRVLLRVSGGAGPWPVGGVIVPRPGPAARPPTAGRQGRQQGCVCH